MFILPYLHTVKKEEIHFIKLFLQKGGTALLHIETDIDTFCKENDIPYTGSFEEKGITYIKVDPSIDLSVFYSFHDPKVDTLEVWRSFVWVGDTDPWGVNQKLEPIQFNGKSVTEFISLVLKFKENSKSFS